MMSRDYHRLFPGRAAYACCPPASAFEVDPFSPTIDYTPTNAYKYSTLTGRGIDR